MGHDMDIPAALPIRIHRLSAVTYRAPRVRTEQINRTIVTGGNLDQFFDVGLFADIRRHGKTTDLPGYLCRPFTTTPFALSAANRRHNPRPMPETPPVTTTTLS